MGREELQDGAHGHTARIITIGGGGFGPLTLIQGERKMSDTCEVVRIVRPECPGGFCEVNKEDLKPEDVIFGSNEKSAKSKKGK